MSAAPAELWRVVPDPVTPQVRHYFPTAVGAEDAVGLTQEIVGGVARFIVAQWQDAQIGRGGERGA